MIGLFIVSYLCLCVLGGFIFLACCFVSGRMSDVESKPTDVVEP